jgi:hypothetical protein
MELAPQTVDKLQHAAGFDFHDGLHDQLAAVIEDGDYNRFLVSSENHSDLPRHWGASPSTINRRLLVDFCLNGLIAA